MAGTTEGGKRAAATNKQRYGSDYYKGIGKLGGVKSRGGGFAANHELAREVGAKGGRNSRRYSIVTRTAKVRYELIPSVPMKETNLLETPPNRGQELKKSHSWWHRIRGVK